MIEYKNIVDIHCHVLPDIDDGPSDWNESLKMISVAMDNNIRKIITTPHWIQGTPWQPSAARVISDVKRLNELLDSRNIGVEVFPGMEIGINENLPRLARNGEILTLANSKYLLLEIPFISLPIGIENLIFSLVSYGFVPVLAHPERNKDLQADPCRILDFIERGALIQITAGSLCGYWGSDAMDCCIELIENDAVFAIASDGHSVDRRPPDMFEALSILERLVGENETRNILSNGEKILKN